MDNHLKADPGNFAGYLQSIVQLEALERMTESLDTELADSQKVMLDIKAIFDSIQTGNNTSAGPAHSHVKYEDLSQFYEGDEPKLLLPDMAYNNSDIDIDVVISTMKGYAEDLKKNFVQSRPVQKTTPNQINATDLEQCASSLDQLSKCLANIKLNKKDEHNNRNPDLEIKLTQLCQDVNMFTQIVQAKTTLSESNENWTATLQDNSSLYYDNIVNKLLSGINEVTYLLQNKN